MNGRTPLRAALSTDGDQTYPVTAIFLKAR